LEPPHNTSKSFRKYLSDILGKHKIKELQRTAILGTAHILWKALMKRPKMFSMGNDIIYTINCNYRIAATLYSLEALFVSGIQL
jgi:hypothetical protein